MRDNVAVVGGQHKQQQQQQQQHHRLHHQQQQQQHHQHKQQEQAKAMKKAYVRFDDYLDLSEENMRRSCKRIMNHLYCEPTAASSELSALPAPTVISCCQLFEFETPTSGSSSTTSSANSTFNSSLTNCNPTSNSLIMQPTQTVNLQAAPPTSTSGKSYLRSQYERRQQRQLELMQQESSSSSTSKENAQSSNNISNHMPICHNQQQDLMAKSHELSKRRFFEKLERRESLNLRPAYNDNSSCNFNKQIGTKNNATTSSSSTRSSCAATLVDCVVDRQEELRKNIDFYGKTTSIVVENGFLESEKIDHADLNDENCFMEKSSSLIEIKNTSEQQQVEKTNEYSRNKSEEKIDSAHSEIVVVLVQSAITNLAQEHENANEDNDEVDEVDENEVEDEIERRNVAIKEECGNSCASSGFGASVSVTSRSSLDNAHSPAIEQQQQIESNAKIERDSANDHESNSIKSSAHEQQRTTTSAASAAAPTQSNKNKSKKNKDNFAGSSEHVARNVVPSARIKFCREKKCAPPAARDNSSSSSSSSTDNEPTNEHQLLLTCAQADYAGGKKALALPDELYPASAVMSKKAANNNSSSNNNSNNNRRSLLIENHSYATILPAPSANGKAAAAAQVSERWSSSSLSCQEDQASIVLEPDACVFGRQPATSHRWQQQQQQQDSAYANVRKQAENLQVRVEYASLVNIKQQQVGSLAKSNPMQSVDCAQLDAATVDSHIMVSGEKNTYSLPVDDAAAAASCYSISSTNNSTGGFSHFAPATRAQCCSPNNNRTFDDDAAAAADGDEPTTDNESSMAAHKKAAAGGLLKRFGSMVSRAFTSSSSKQSKLEKLNQQQQQVCATSRTTGAIRSSNGECLSKLEKKGIQAPGINSKGINASYDNKSHKSVLVIEQAASAAVAMNSHCQVNSQVHAQVHAQVDQADLVILPAKHVVDQLEASCACLPQANNAQLTRRRRLRACNNADDSLARVSNGAAAAAAGKVSALAANSCSLASSSSLPISASASQQVGGGGEKAVGKARRRADSLSEDLESLMSKCHQHHNHHHHRPHHHRHHNHRHHRHHHSSSLSSLSSTFSSASQSNYDQRAKQSNSQQSAATAATTTTTIGRRKSVNKSQAWLAASGNRRLELESKMVKGRTHIDIDCVSRQQTNEQQEANLKKEQVNCNSNRYKSLTCKTLATGKSSARSSLLRLLSPSPSSSPEQQQQQQQLVSEKSSSFANNNNNKNNTDSAPNLTNINSRAQVSAQVNSYQCTGGSGGGKARKKKYIFNEMSKQDKTNKHINNEQQHEKSIHNDNTEQQDHFEQPLSGFWGFSSLIGANHERQQQQQQQQQQRIVDNKKEQRGKKKSRPTTGGCDKKSSWRSDQENDDDHDNNELYSNLAAGYSLHLSPAISDHDETENDEQATGSESLIKYQSLNLYQNLLRNYTKKRSSSNSNNNNNHRHHHHHHRRHHHHHHHHHRTSCSPAATSSLCDSSTATSAGAGGACVWGQLIKINKSDGSQVIELQRSPGKSWGFFVARGSINNVKGIFISRMHDKLTSSSLAGLLSIGDGILAIDEQQIEPDYDILRVNQLISKKSKILLKVKPFKG